MVLTYVPYGTFARMLCGTCSGVLRLVHADHVPKGIFENRDHSIKLIFRRREKFHALGLVFFVRFAAIGGVKYARVEPPFFDQRGNRIHVFFDFLLGVLTAGGFASAADLGERDLNFLLSFV